MRNKILDRQLEWNLLEQVCLKCENDIYEVNC